MSISRFFVVDVARTGWLFASGCLVLKNKTKLSGHNYMG